MSDDAAAVSNVSNIGVVSSWCKVLKANPVGRPGRHMIDYMKVVKRNHSMWAGFRGSGILMRYSLS